MERDFDQQLVYGFFRQHPLMTLTTMSEDGVPQNAAVYVYMDENMHCYCVTRATSRKYKNVNHNNLAVLSTQDENVLMFGELLCEAHVLNDAAKIAVVMPELQKIVESRKSSYWVPPVSQLEGDSYVFIEIKPKSVTFVNYEKSTSEDTHPHKVAFSFAQ